MNLVLAMGAEHTKPEKGVLLRLGWKSMVKYLPSNVLGSGAEITSPISPFARLIPLASIFQLFCLHTTFSP